MLYRFTDFRKNKKSRWTECLRSKDMCLLCWKLHCKDDMLFVWLAVTLDGVTYVSAMVILNKITMDGSSLQIKCVKPTCILTQNPWFYVFILILSSSTCWTNIFWEGYFLKKKKKKRRANAQTSQIQVQDWIFFVSYVCWVAFALPVLLPAKSLSGHLIDTVQM